MAAGSSDVSGKLSADQRRRETLFLKDLASFYSINDGFQKLQAALDYRAVRKNLRGRRVLELGCADGAMTGWLARDKYEVVAVEGAPDYVERARAHVGREAPGVAVTVVESLFEEFATDQAFDDILLLNVLHHVEAPDALLRRVRDWMGPDGRVHVIVPNAFSLHRRVGVAMGTLEALHDLTTQNVRMHHRRVFDASSLSRLLRQSGLAVESIEGVLLKPFSGRQMEDLAPELVIALDEVGKSFPELCHHVYLTAKRD